MPNIIIKFTLPLVDYSKGVLSPEGALFHRWLPDGRKDSISLKSNDPNIVLRIWFERLGYIESDFLYFDKNRKELNESIINRQGALWSGPLHGEISIDNLTDKQCGVISQNKIGNKIYVKFGRDLIKNCFEPSIKKLVETFRINYGQYWINEFEAWDSRNESLGSYCRKLKMKWRTKRGRKWFAFLPNEPKREPLSILLGENETYHENITKKDWAHIQSLQSIESGISLALKSLTKTKEYFDDGRLSEAFIQGHTTIELALEEYLRNIILGNDILKENTDPIMDNNRTRLPFRFTVIAVSSNLATHENITNTLAALKIRNRIVHEGVAVHAGEEVYLKSLLETAKSILSFYIVKLPDCNTHENMQSSDEGWDKYYEDL